MLEIATSNPPFLYLTGVGFYFCLQCGFVWKETDSLIYWGTARGSLILIGLEYSLKLMNELFGFVFKASVCYFWLHEMCWAVDPRLLVVQSVAVSLLQGDGVDHTRAENNLSQCPVTSPRLSGSITGGGNPGLDGWSLILGQQLLKIPVGQKVKTSSFTK